MSEEIRLHKTVFDKAQYEKTIDTTFNELGVTTIAEELESQPSVEEFFSLYNQLFYVIPELGEINSHEFIIQQSSAYVDSEVNNEVIEELQREISQLRTQLLDSQRQIVELETGTTVDISTPDTTDTQDLISSAEQFIGGSTGGGTTSGGVVSGGTTSGGGY